MFTITTVSVVLLGVKIAIFIGGVLGIIYLENLINKKPSLKKGGNKHETEHHPEITLR